jgi:hypothetical protein
MEKNALDVDLNTPVYRIFPRNRILQALTEKRLALVKPASWDDPFENFLLKAKAKIGKEEASLEELRAKLYGQCWMMCPESDAMWRIYSKVPKKGTAEGLTDEVGVKVRATVGKLFSALWASSDQKPELCFWVGKVQYLTQAEMDEVGADNDLMQGWAFDPTAKGHAKSLLLKRDAFAHEHEVRLIFGANNGYDKAQPVYLFGIDPNTVFEEIILDPRLTEEHCKELGAAVQGTGYAGKISQSSLYLPPQYTITIQ